MQRKTLVLVLLGALAVGWRLGHWQAAHQRHDARHDMIRQITQNREMLDDCYLNMANQFTPGFRTSFALLWLEAGRATLSTAQGQIFPTQTASNLAVKGSAFMLVGSPAAPVYTRDGRFTLVEGRLEDNLGRPVLGYPSGSSELAPIESARFNELGETPGFSLALAVFPHPEFLARVGSTGVMATPESGPPQLGTAGTLPGQILCPGSVELANVDFNQQGMMIGALKDQADMLGVPLAAPAPRPMQPMMPMLPMMAPGADPLSLGK